MNWRLNDIESDLRPTRRLRRVVDPLVRRWAYGLTLIPAVMEWLDSFHMPSAPWEIAKMVCLSAVIGVCVWRLYRESAKLKRLSETDELTGIYNRRRFNEDLVAEATRSRRLGIPLSLLYLDVDNFKRFNDSQGHATGDRVLENVAALLKRSIRRHMDSCYRIGGDEFAVLMLGAHAPEAVAAMKRRRDELVQGTLLERDDIRLSVGAVELNGDTPSELVKKADRNMYAAKRGEPLLTEPDNCFARI